MADREGKAESAAPVYFRGYIEELDGLRAVGLSLVLINHFTLTTFPQWLYQLGNLGWIAMDSFFVMSGFLITGILLDSHNKPHFFGKYYLRRALRIFPLYYAVLLFWYVILTRTNYGSDYHNMRQYWGSPGWFAFYLGNLREAVVSLSSGKLSSTVKWAYGPLWSLQIEEQFYLLFPLAVAFLKKDHLRNVLIAAACLSPLLRILLYCWNPANPDLQYTLLPCHCEGIALGALIAIRFRSGPWRISRDKLGWWTCGLMAAAVAGSVLTTWGTRNEAWQTVWNRLAGYSISSLACACLVLWLICSRGSAETMLLRLPPVRFIGKICYGIYLLHPVGHWMVLEANKKGWIRLKNNDPMYVVYGVGLSVVLALISWYCFEGLFLRLKDKIPYGRPVGSSAKVVPITGTGG
ncbi:acyltransferase family protein [Acidicapsa dinghuensis]|uniref:Acyltransferase family protein n=1 Tax=Acidicapsa dinghuensis TaxID=2218256 RepID=A0ABW1EKQ2_9BACT|nr:acyltransferase [Acidicapsa dinghuensis]